MGFWDTKNFCNAIVKRGNLLAVCCEDKDSPHDHAKAVTRPLHSGEVLQRDVQNPNALVLLTVPEGKVAVPKRYIAVTPEHGVVVIGPHCNRPLGPGEYLMLDPNRLDMFRTVEIVDKEPDMIEIQAKDLQEGDLVDFLSCPVLKEQPSAEFELGEVVEVIPQFANTVFIGYESYGGVTYANNQTLRIRRRDLLWR